MARSAYSPAISEIVRLAGEWPDTKWLVVSADASLAEALHAAGAATADSPARATGAIVYDALHQLSDEELTTFAAFLREGRPFLASAPNAAHGSARLAGLTGQAGAPGAVEFEAMHTRLEGCGLNITDVVGVAADVLASEVPLDTSELPPEVLSWLRTRPGALTSRFIMLGVRTDAPERSPLPPARSLGSLPSRGRDDDAAALAGERESKAAARAEQAEARAEAAEAEVESMRERLEEVTQALAEQRESFASRLEQMRAEIAEEERKALAQRTEEREYARRAELKAATKAEKRLRAELEHAHAALAAAGISANGMADAPAMPNLPQEPTPTEAPAWIEAEAGNRPSDSGEEAAPAPVAAHAEAVADEEAEATASSAQEVEPEPAESAARGGEAEAVAELATETETEHEPRTEAQPEAAADSGAEAEAEPAIAEGAEGAGSRDTEGGGEPAGEGESLGEPEPEQRSRFGRFFRR